MINNFGGNNGSGILFFSAGNTATGNYLGTDVSGALATLEAMGADIIGLNCSTGPDLMRDSVRYLSLPELLG